MDSLHSVRAKNAYEPLVSKKDSAEIKMQLCSSRPDISILLPQNNHRGYTRDFPSVNKQFQAASTLKVGTVNANFHSYTKQTESAPLNFTTAAEF
jgi:hypothetical protein